MTSDPRKRIPARQLDELCVNTLRFLSVDAVQRANSGHPGLPLGAGPQGQGFANGVGMAIAEAHLFEKR